MNSFLNSNIFLIIILIINFMLLILYILDNIKLNKLRKNYSEFMRKMGNGNDILEMINKYVDAVEKINLENKELEEYCQKLQNRTDNCIHKIGLVRYNAFKDTGSNLSFAVSLLDEKNNGVVFNGIYSRDSSNIYCKTVKNGESEYALSNEEKEAIKEAIKINYEENNGNKK